MNNNKTEMDPLEGGLGSRKERSVVYYYYYLAALIPANAANAQRPPNHRFSVFFVFEAQYHRLDSLNTNLNPLTQPRDTS